MLRCMFKRRQCRIMDGNDINMDELRKMVDNGAILVDIRSPQEYNEGHLEKSILIPEYELRIKAKDILVNKEEIIIVYCGSGIRSKKAQRILNKMGYINVYNLYRGFENY